MRVARSLAIGAFRIALVGYLTMAVGGMLVLLWMPLPYPEPSKQ